MFIGFNRTILWMDEFSQFSDVQDDLYNRKHGPVQNMPSAKHFIIVLILSYNVFESCVHIELLNSVSKSIVTSVMNAVKSYGRIFE